MMTCKEAGKLISEQKDHPLPLGRRLGLWLHLLACKMCTTYKNQLELISTVSKRAGDIVMGSENPSLSPDSKDRLKQRLSSND